VDIRTGFRNAAPDIYRRVRRGYHLARLLGHTLRRDEDFFDFLKDLSIKSPGTAEKECPLCGFVGFFKAWGSPPRWNALCPSCGSLERHRHLALFLHRTPSLIKDGAILLHFAPENFIRTLLKKSNMHYIGADLARDDVDLKLDIENIDLADEQCDVIVCSHVLEHVDDKRALSELWRILKPNGILIIMVPINDGCETTYEDDTIKDRNQRLIHFGDPDHVRIYGADFVQRLTDAGFRVRVTTAFGKEAVKFALLMGDKIFLCHKADKSPT
jgi:Methyltransferase domain